jgi:hypothetical protein
VVPGHGRAAVHRRHVAHPRPRNRHGSIFISEQIDIGESDTPETLVCKAVSLGHDQYKRVLGALAAGQVFEAVPQRELGEGRTFYTSEWKVSFARAVRFLRSAAWRAGFGWAGAAGKKREQVVDRAAHAQAALKY